MKIETPEYTLYSIACPPQPSGYSPTVEQIVAGECGRVLHGPDAVSSIATLVFAILIVLVLWLGLLRIVERSTK